MIALDTLIGVLHDFPHVASALMMAWNAFWNGDLRRLNRSLEDQMRMVLGQDTHSMPLMNYQAVADAVRSVGNAEEWELFYDARYRALQGRRQPTPVIAVAHDASHNTSTPTDDTSDQQPATLRSTGATHESSGVSTYTGKTGTTATTESMSNSDTTTGSYVAPARGRLSDVVPAVPLPPHIRSAAMDKDHLPSDSLAPDPGASANIMLPPSAHPVPVQGPVLPQNDTPPQVSPNAVFLDVRDRNDNTEEAMGCQPCCAIL